MYFFEYKHYQYPGSREGVQVFEVRLELQTGLLGAPSICSGTPPASLM